MNSSPDVFQVGLARRVITPRQPMYLAGFASRNRPSEGVLHDLWAKAMAVRDAAGETVVFVSADIIGLTAAICEEVAATVRSTHGLERRQLVFNASHTHSGPVIDDVLLNIFDGDDEHRQRIRDFTQQLKGVLAELIAEALGRLEPARLHFGHANTGFAVNRRQVTPNGIINGCNPDGPGDFDVPVLEVTSLAGELRALLFGYACHTTTITSDSYVFNGDYAGFAQIALEEKYSGAQAMFMMLCGADQNALPRGTVTRSQRYGERLALAVERARARGLQAVRGPLRTAFETATLEFQPHTRELFETRLREGDFANKYGRRHAEAMLQAYDAGQPLREIAYPVQAVSFGDDLTMLTLAGEVVVDYALRVKREYGREKLVVAGYSNGIMSYIPSLRVLREGGYEGGGSMIFFGLPMPYAENVEERIFDAIHEVMRQVGRQPISEQEK